jgi:hypothetical protein
MIGLLEKERRVIDVHLGSASHSGSNVERLAEGVRKVIELYAAEKSTTISSHAAANTQSV